MGVELTGAALEACGRAVLAGNATRLFNSGKILLALLCFSGIS